MADGELSGAPVKDRLGLLEQRRSELEMKLEAALAEPDVVLHPAAPTPYHRLVEQFAEVLAQPETLEIAKAREAFRAVIRSAVVSPSPSEDAST